MEKYLSTNAIKKSILLKCAHYMEQALIPVFQKEDWKIFRLGNERSDFSQVTSYDGALDSEALQQVFSVHHFDLLVYDLRQTLGRQSVSDLEQMLQLAAHHADRIVLLSGADVFNTKQTGVEETAQMQADNKEGMYLFRLETLALSWKKQGLPITILRFPDIYGLGMGWNDGFTARYLYMCAEKEKVPVYKTDERRELLSVRDAAYAVLQTYERGYTGDYLHIAPVQSVTYNEFYEMIDSVAAGTISVDAQRQGSFAQALLSPSLAKQQIGWQARNRVSKEDLAAMYQDITQTVNRKNKLRQKKRRKRRFAAWKETLIPYIENSVGAFVMLGVAKLQNGHTVNPVVPFDFNFLYISIMGLLYGRRHAFLAVFFSYIILLFSQFSDLGFGLISILYSPEELLHFLSYLVIGVLSGYVAEQSKFSAQAARWQHLHDLGQYRFLRRLFDENVKLKDKMYRQIVNTQDSMGRMYHIVSSLDSVEPENIYNKTALVTAKILDVSQVSIYVIGKNKAYLRQKVRIGDKTEEEPHSLKIEDYPYLQQMMRDHKLFINRDLLKGIPDMAVPIIYEDQVIAVIQIYQMNFDKWSIYQLNLMAVTSRLVSAALARAYSWEEETMQRYYIPDTRILKEDKFIQIIEKLRERRQMQRGYSIMMAKVDLPGMTYKQIDQQIGTQIRTEDYIGILDKAVWLVFPDVDMKILMMIQKRLTQGGVPISDTKEVL